MKEQKIIINLSNGDQLVAEDSTCDRGQISVGIMHDGVWIQDLVVVENQTNKEGQSEDKYDIYVFGDEYDEGYTECFEVDRIPSDAL